MAWSAERIKRVHDEHIHFIKGQPITHPPCPGCRMCKCPVHRTDPHAVVEEK